jgi:hypothetical protein
MLISSVACHPAYIIEGIVPAKWSRLERCIKMRHDSYSAAYVRVQGSAPQEVEPWLYQVASQRNPLSTLVCLIALGEAQATQSLLSTSSQHKPAYS